MKKTILKMKAMKMIIPVFVVAVLMTACNSTPRTAAMNSNILPAQDTSGLAQFQQWKAKNELAAMTQFQNATAPPAATTTIVKYVPVSSSRTRSTSSRSSGSMSSSSSGTAKAAQKKGWSKAAKGGVIGGVGGAVAGAVINKKNRALGAVIGGVIGAAGGYGIGRGMDKKDGRF
ncbi:MAG: glycine zipper 2TM domain-containing protein [Flavisolibacter sp.]